MKNFQGKHILVADDEEGIRDIFKDEFEQLGAQVSEATNGIEALQIIHTKHIDLVLSDIRMPGGDGVKLLAEIIKTKKPIPVILMTGFSDWKIEELLKMGARSVFTKPFNLEAVMEKIDRILEEQK